MDERILAALVLGWLFGLIVGVLMGLCFMAWLLQDPERTDQKAGSAHGS